ncbi:MAG: hypothetical protein FJY98_01645 [Candidatus Liptonbacteria bacterium]|nr:hypothetical protein [Candidatus Pacearchaeota archaeon]MBM3257012.1 hypothetical protein [Candidatus Liptonbacteria bacterium]
MKQDNSIYLRRYIYSFFIATFLFILVFAIADSFTHISYERNARESEVIRSYITDLNGYFKEQSCSDQLIFDASLKLDNVGNRIDLLEKRFGKSDQRVVTQKKQYAELQHTHYLIIQRLNKYCGAKFITVLYFYTQAKEESDANEQASFILNAFKQESPERIMIYAFDSSIGSGIVGNLKTWYNITSTPSVLVNQENKIDKLTHISQLDPFLKEVR